MSYAEINYLKASGEANIFRDGTQTYLRAASDYGGDYGAV